MAPRYTLGVNIGFHDAAAALLRDGRLRWLVPQERISRKRHALAESPAPAVEACLDAEGITAAALDGIAIGWDFAGTRLGRSRRFSPEGLRKLLFGRDGIAELPPVQWVRHHLAHAASGYYSCGRDEAAILVIDGAGESQCTTLALGGDHKIDILREWPVSQSLGFLYTAASRWSGFGDWGPGKLMGLAAYGRARGGLAARATPDGYEVMVDGRQLALPGDGDDGEGPMLTHYPAFENAIESVFAQRFPYAPRAGEDAIAYADLAADVQLALEESVLGLAKEARRRTGADALVIAGGVAMNCSMIGRIVQSGLFDHVYVPPVANDVGVSLGAALVAARDTPAFCPETIDHAYWALPVDEDAACEEAHRRGLFTARLGTPGVAAFAGDAVAAGKVVAWARGRGEIGERALGARSIVADPRDRRTLERLNDIKGREMWRPVAPSVQLERAGEVIDGRVGHPARFMLEAATVAGAARTRVPATTHVDGSARPQLVDRHDNEAYWQLIERFREISGIPCVVNTSFNLAGEPIVNTAADAVDSFVRATGIDLLVVEDIVVARSEEGLPPR